MLRRYEPRERSTYHVVARDISSSMVATSPSYINTVRLRTRSKIAMPANTSDSTGRTDTAQLVTQLADWQMFNFKFVAVMH